ncbi:MAG: S8 family serine peptidase [Planctomycetes bacterium]|nr:S8 family serine peptidase [Planctomycetota bacterium]
MRRLAEGGERHVLVRFQRAPSAHEQELWRAAGVELGHALGAGAFFARVDPGALAGRAERLGGLIDVRELALERKLHPTLLAGETPSWTVVSLDERGEPTVAVYVLLQEDVALERGDALLRELGGSSFDLLESLNGIVAFVPRSRLQALATSDLVAWVEPAMPKMDSVSMPAAAAPLNDSNRALTQANTLQGAPYNLDGSGVSVMVYDGGTARATHADFGGRVTVRDASGMIDHATHVSGTVGGSGASSGGTFRGMAPGVTIESYGFEYDGIGIFLFTNPGDFEDDYDEAINVFGADLANNSIGTNTEPNGFFCHLQGDYGVMCSLIDGVVRGSLGAPIRVLWANGNERQGSRCDVEGFGDYYSAAPPATAKNHITVGALNSNDDSMTSFSSWGPTDDGRLKPDISAPGCQAGGDGGVTSPTAASDVSTAAFCGTSMASPTTCGLSALILEDWRVQFGAPDPLNSTLKVLLAHTAVDLGNVGPDFQTGYGSVRAQACVDFMRLGQFVEDTLAETGAYLRWTVSVAPATSVLRLTLAWDDAPALPNVLGSLVNDLDLFVRDPLGNRHHVWTLDPANPSAAAVRTQVDRRNNIEQVLVNSPIAGTWTVELRGHDVPEGPQLFSLASSHAFTAVPHVRISFPSALPSVLTPGVTTPVIARIVGVSDTLVGGSPTLHVRYAGASYLALPMSALGGDLFQANLPPAVCTANPEFYFSAQGATSGIATHPAAAPSEVLDAFVATVTTVFTDDFQADLGWTVANTAVTDGAWARGTPGGVGERCDPQNSFGGSGLCFVTGLGVTADLDGGPTRLTSPLFDLSASGEYVASYARWYVNDDYDIDRMQVEVSNNNGTSWTLVESVDNNAGDGGWVETSFVVNALVAPTNQVRVRLSVTDNPNDSVTEGGLDAFRIERRTCAALPDCNANGILDSDDTASGRSSDFNSNSVPDECELVFTPPNKPLQGAGPTIPAPPMTAP